MTKPKLPDEVWCYTRDSLKNGARVETVESRFSQEFAESDCGHDTRAGYPCSEVARYVLAPDNEREKLRNAVVEAARALSSHGIDRYDHFQCEIREACDALEAYEAAEKAREEGR